MQKPCNTPSTAQLTLIEACQHTNRCIWQYSWQCHAVKAFLPFLQGIPAWYTELHRAYPGWLVRKTQVFICPSHDHLLSKEFEDDTKTSYLYTTYLKKCQIVVYCYCKN